MTYDKRMPMDGASDITVAEGGMLNLWHKHSTSAHVKPITDY